LVPSGWPLSISQNVWPELHHSAAPRRKTLTTGRVISRLAGMVNKTRTPRRNGAERQRNDPQQGEQR
jgi:hypothetical protein